MKTILVPTDFSPSADNAMNYAAQLAQMVDASILLVHVYQIPISMNDVPVLMVSAEELKNNADRGLERAGEQVQKNYPAIIIEKESRLGNVVEELKDICSEIKPLAIVVGKHGASGAERFLFGSTTLSIIRHLAYPVVSIPDSTTSFQLNNVALAADNTDLSLQEARIRDVVENIKTQLHIVHVQESGKDIPGLRDLMPDLDPVYKTIRNSEFVSGIEHYVRTNAIDLLMILPHKHSLMERLFFKTHTAELIEKIRIPIMCIPEA